MKSHKALLALTLSAACAIPTLAYAQPPGSPPPQGPRQQAHSGPPPHQMMQTIREADTNNDGRTTYEEITQQKPGFPRETFDRMDRNDDGVISREDRFAPPGQGPPEGAPNAQRRDDYQHRGQFQGRQNRDQRQSQFGPGPAPSPLISRLDELMKSADTNEDGKVTAQEFDQIADRVANAYFEHADRNGDGAVSTDEMQRPGPPETSSRLPERRGGMRDADANADGLITFEEITQKNPNFTRESFDRMDRNNDGVLSPDDRPRRQ